LSGGRERVRSSTPVGLQAVEKLAHYVSDCTYGIAAAAAPASIQQWMAEESACLQMKEKKDTHPPRPPEILSEIRLTARDTGAFEVRIIIISYFELYIGAPILQPVSKLQGAYI
jgi:hypothetical protein